MTQRRPTAVFATAYPSQTGTLVAQPRALPALPAVNAPRDLGNRDTGGSLGSSFVLPQATGPGAPGAPGAPGTPAAAGSDCCG